MERGRLGRQRRGVRDGRPQRLVPQALLLSPPPAFPLSLLPSPPLPASSIPLLRQPSSRRAWGRPWRSAPRRWPGLGGCWETQGRTGREAAGAARARVRRRCGQGTRGERGDCRGRWDDRSLHPLRLPPRRPPLCSSRTDWASPSSSTRPPWPGHDGSWGTTRGTAPVPSPQLPLLPPLLLPRFLPPPFFLPPFLLPLLPPPLPPETASRGAPPLARPPLPPPLLPLPPDAG